MEKLLKWELIGILFIILLGSFLHFAYALSGCWTPIAVIAAVNESVWEHFKLGIWPAFFFALIEYKIVKKEVNNFLIAKTVSIYSIPAIIGLLFYSYVTFTGDNIVFIDISLFIIAVIVAQITSYVLLKREDLGRRWRILAIGALLTLLILVSLFTFAPPHYFLFRDSSGVYGIPNHCV